MGDETKYVAAQRVAVGYDEPDPDRPGFKLVKVFEEGEEVDPGFPNVQGLIDQGYILEEVV